MHKTIKPQFIFFIGILLLIIEQGALDIYLPSLPAMTHAFQTTSSSIQYTIALFMAGLIAARMILGPIADVIGRRPILLISNTVFIIGTLGCMLTSNIYWLWTFRVIQGMGAGGVSVLSLTLVSDVYQGSAFARYASYMAVAWAAVPIVAPLLGGYIQHYGGWRYNFATVAVIAILVQVFCFFKLPETCPEKQASINIKAMLAGYKTLLTHGEFMRYSLMLAILSGVFFVFSTLGPFLIQTHLGYSAVAFGWFSVITASGYMISSYINGRVVLTTSDIKLSRWGSIAFIAVAVVLLIFSLTHLFNIWTLVVPMSAIFFAIGFIYANGMNGCIAPFPKLAGTANALMGVFIFLGSIAGSLIATRLSYRTLLDLAVLMLVSACLNIAIFMFKQPSNKH